MEANLHAVSEYKTSVQNICNVLVYVVILLLTLQRTVVNIHYLLFNIKKLFNLPAEFTYVNTQVNIVLK
jgi:hypothetical protein